MRPTDLLIQVAGVLERLGVDYAVVGSMASSFYGEAQLTNDVDILAELRPEHVGEFVRAFPTNDFYLSEEAAPQAVGNRSQFNIIHPESGLKVDIMIPGVSAFDQTRMRRRLRVTPPETQSEIFFASAEDVILKKMDFYREGGSEKHLRDIAGMLKVRGHQIDRDYIAEWAEQLELNDVWMMILSRVQDAH